MNIKTNNRRRSSFRDFCARFAKNKTAMLGLIILLLMMLLALLAPAIVPYSAAVNTNGAVRLNPPSAEHLFGTDHLGRDVFARILHGAKYSLSIGFISTVISLIIGAVLGAMAGYMGNRVDNIIMRICDIFQSIPGTLLVLAIVAVLGTSFLNLVVALTVASVPSMIRIIRAAVITVTEEDYVEAAKSYLASDLRIMLRYIIPNAMGPIIVSATMNMAAMIISAAGLSYIGMGVQPPTPEWGNMLSDAEEYFRRAGYLLYFPGLSILLAALSVNLVGDGLRDALDPRLKN